MKKEGIYDVWEISDFQIGDEVNISNQNGTRQVTNIDNVDGKLTVNCDAIPEGYEIDYQMVKTNFTYNYRLKVPHDD